MILQSLASSPLAFKLGIWRQLSEAPKILGRCALAHFFLSAPVCSATPKEGSEWLNKKKKKKRKKKKKKKKNKKRIMFFLA